MRVAFGYFVDFLGKIGSGEYLWKRSYKEKERKMKGFFQRRCDYPWDLSTWDDERKKKWPLVFVRLLIKKKKTGFVI